MKTWEMIKELTENPNKKFKLKNEEVYLENIDGEISLEEIDWFGDKDRWEEIRKPVDFMTAIKSGKHVGVEYSGARHEEMSLPNLFYELQQDYSDKTIRQMILNGKWYIEED